MSAQQTQQQSSSQTSSSDPRRQQTSLARRPESSTVSSVLLDPMDFFNMNPFAVFRRMQEEISRALTQGGTNQLSRADALPGAWTPAVEVAYRDGNLVVSAELPGLTENDVDVQLVDNHLVISGEKQVTDEQNQGNIRRTEIRYGQFYRAIPLPEGVKADQANARFQNGVLRITIPLEQSNVRQIPVQADTSLQSGTRQSSGQETSKSSSQKDKAA
jgi:HSP20 family protein